MGKPTIEKISHRAVNNSVRAMDRLNLNAIVAGDGRPLAYRWSLVSAPPHVRLSRTDHRLTDLEVWSQAPGAAFVQLAARAMSGGEIRVRLAAWYRDGVGASDNEAVHEETFTVHGVNHPPLPMISRLPESVNAVNGALIGLDGYNSIGGGGDPLSHSAPSWSTRNFTGRGAPIVFQSGVWIASVQIPQQPADCRIDVVLQLEKGLHVKETHGRVLISGGEVATPEPEPEPTPEPEPPDEENNDMDTVRIYVECKDGILPLDASVAVIDWLVAEGYVKRPDHYLDPWTSPYTLAQVAAKRNQYRPPEPEPEPVPEPESEPTPPAPPQGRYVKRLSLRVGVYEGIRFDSGIQVIAGEKTRAEFRFYRGAATGQDDGIFVTSREVVLGPENPRNWMVHGDWDVESADLCKVISDRPVSAISYHVFPSDLPVRYASFPAMDG